jgi:hypothetical protein
MGYFEITKSGVSDAGNAEIFSDWKPVACRTEAENPLREASSGGRNGAIYTI